MTSGMAVRNGLVAPGKRDLTNTPDRRNVLAKLETVLQGKLAPILRAENRLDLEPGSKAKESELRQRLVMVCDAWDDFQECRKRDAVYGYLKTVFA